VALILFGPTLALVWIYPRYKAQSVELPKLASQLADIKANSAALEQGVAACSAATAELKQETADAFSRRVVLENKAAGKVVARQETIASLLIDLKATPEPENECKDFIAIIDKYTLPSSTNGVR
jgi:predicted  nucleic acid-binding Zn-ribbon protein